MSYSKAKNIDSEIIDISSHWQDLLILAKFPQALFHSTRL